MAEERIYIPRTSDRSLLECFVNMLDKYSGRVKSERVSLIGNVAYKTLRPNPGEKEEEIINLVKESNSKLINTISLNIDGLSVIFERGGFNQNEPSPVYDGIKINADNSSLSETERIDIITTITKKLGAFDPTRKPSSILSEEQQRQLDIHLSAIRELEALNARLTEKVTQDIYEQTKKLDQEYRTRQDELTQQIAEDRRKLQEGIDAEKTD